MKTTSQRLTLSMFALIFAAGAISLASEVWADSQITPELATAKAALSPTNFALDNRLTETPSIFSFRGSTGTLVPRDSFPLPLSVETVDPSFNGSLSDGYTRVEAVAVQPDGKIVVGGGFPLVNAVRRPGLARLNVDGSLDNTFSGIAGFFVDIVIQPDGKILVAGSVTGIARLNSDGTLDTTFTPGSGTNDLVNDILLLSDGKIIISGNFTQYNGTAISRVARLNANGNLDASFNPPTIDDSIQEAALQSDGKIIIVGSFSTVDSIIRHSIARLSTNGSHDTSFDAGTNAITSRGSVAIQEDGKILVGGTSVGLRRLNSTGTIDPSFTPSNQSDLVGTTHKIIVLSDGKILAGGALGEEDFDPVFGIVKFNSNGTVDTTFTKQQNIDGGLEVFAIDLTPDGKIVAVGDLYKFGSISSFNKHIARLKSDGTIDTAFTGSIEGFGVARVIVRQQDGKILVGGNFEAVNGNPRRSIVRFNSDGSVDSSFGAGTNRDVYAIALQPDGKILIGGEFSLVNNLIPTGAARLNADGSLDPTFNTAAFESTTIYTIAVQPDGKILVGGLTRGVIRVNSDGSLDNSFPLPNSAVFIYEISLSSNGQIYAVGSFRNFAGSGRNHIVRLNSNGTVDNSFNTGTGPNSNVRTIALQPDGKLLIGGNFTSVNAVNAGRIARLHADGSIDPTFSTGAGFNSTVFDLTLQPNSSFPILAGGAFTSYNGIAKNRFAQLNGDGSLGDFAANVDSTINAAAIQPDGKILIGGSFTVVDDQAHLGIARLNVNPTAPVVTVTGRVTTPAGLGLRNASVSITDSRGLRQIVTTTSFGFYSFESVRSGESHTLRVNSKRYRFSSRVVQVSGNLGDVDFVGLE